MLLFHARFDSGRVQGVEVMLSGCSRKVAFENDRPTTEEFFDMGRFALEQGRQVGFGRWQVDAWHEAAIEDDSKVCVVHGEHPCGLCISDISVAIVGSDPVRLAAPVGIPRPGGLSVHRPQAGHR
ncbi:hypothetical protein D9M73_232900 [compost metagenome]